MIGNYDYTVWLTYISFLSACSGIFMTLAEGKPVLGIICLLVSGLCDAFDGKVASTKKDRSEFEKRFGVQIDSLSDVVAFGILPGVIGIAEFRAFVLGSAGLSRGLTFLSVAVYIISMIYMLAAYIRLAYFNVSEEDRQKTEGGRRKTYTGLPVTSASLIFPMLYLFRLMSEEVFVTAFFAAMLLMSFLFLVNIQIKKPGRTGIIIMIAVGSVEFILLMLFKLIL